MVRRKNAAEAEKSGGDDLIRGMLKDLKEDLGDRCDMSVMGDAMFAAEPREGFSSGLTLLDHHIGGAIKKTYVVGRMVEIFGPVASAKSMLVGTAIGIAQREHNAVCALIDTEQAYSTAFMRKQCHADPDNIIYLDPNNLEDCWGACDRFITRVRERDEKRPILIGIDSLAALPPKDEDEADFDEQTSMALAARVNKKAMRKLRRRLTHERASIIIVNQEIAKINAAAFGEKTTTGGGFGPKYYSSVRLQLDQIQKVSEGDGADRMVVGVRYRVSIYKNRFSFHGPKVDFLVTPNGIDDIDSVVTYLKDKHQLGSESKGRLVWDGEKLTVKQLKEKARENSNVWEQLKALATQTIDRTLDVPDEADTAETVDGAE